MFELSVQAEGQDNYRMQNVNYEFWENILWRLSLCTGPVELVSKSRNKVHQTWLKPFSRALYSRLCEPHMLHYAYADETGQHFEQL